MNSTPFPLLPVPPFHHELTIKASAAGITILKGSRFRKRYTGSRQSAIDINGKMFLRAADLKKIIRDQDTKPRVRGTAATQSDIALTADAIQRPPKNYKVAKTEVRNRIFGMINTQRGKKELYFWTVTFPEGTGDSIAYRLFQVWLTTLRQKKWLREYLWIAERQQKGTVHFHLAIPHQLSVVAANNAMRTILKTAAKRNEIPFNVYQCKRYNGIDIAKNRKTRKVTNFAIKKGSRSLANYLTKYITKNDTGFAHLAWHNSRGFSALFTGITFTVREFLGYGFRQLVLPGKIIDNEYFMFFAWRDGPPIAVSNHLSEINSWIQDQTGILNDVTKN
jgi:hypothetical protein